MSLISTPFMWQVSVWHSTSCSLLFIFTWSITKINSPNSLPSLTFYPQFLSYLWYSSLVLLFLFSLLRFLFLPVLHYKYTFITGNIRLRIKLLGRINSLLIKIRNMFKTNMNKWIKPQMCGIFLFKTTSINPQSSKNSMQPCKLSINLNMNSILLKLNKYLFLNKILNYN